MKRYSSWRDPDVWSQVGLVLLPFLGLAALLLLTSPDSRRKNRAAALERDKRATPRIVIPQALSPDVLPKLAAISPRGFADVIDRMALDTESEVAEIEPEVISEYTPRPPIAVERKGIPVPHFQVRTFVSGLAGPDGIAIDPRTGNILVCEENAHRIAMITPRGRIRTVIDSRTRLYVRDGLTEKRIAPLHSPEGIAMDRFGRLYVVEDREKGRILAIEISENGAVGPAEVITVPNQSIDLRWKGVAVRDTGELILMGFTAEDALKTGSMIQGALVYRDADKRWWVPIMRPMAGLSDVKFSIGGHFAVYADEITGTLGWIDLQSRYLREGASQQLFKSPKGVCVLSDGRLAIAEEGGRVSIVDPEVDAVQVIAEGLGSIESLVWDDRGNRLLVTSDSAGQIFELIPDASLATGIDRMRRAPCHSEGAIRRVPASAPAFIRPLLELGGLSENIAEFDLAFDELTRRVPILATDARAILLHGAGEAHDPVTHVRFVALDPNRLRFDEPGFDFGLSALILRTRSGKIYKTKFTRTIVLSGNLWSGKIENHGIFELPLPFAYHAQPGPRGHAVIHFTGLGRSPDISIALNPSNPEESYMVITHLTGLIEQYRLVQTRAPDGSENSIISMPARRQTPWLKIADPLTDVRAETSL